MKIKRKRDKEGHSTGKKGQDKAAIKREDKKKDQLKRLKDKKERREDMYI